MTATTEAATAPSRTTPAFLSGTAVAIVLALSTFKGLTPFTEPDLWWHLRTGDRLRDGVGLVAPDPSAGLAAHDYVATQWLPEVTASWAYSWGGAGAILWLRCAAIVMLVTAVYLLGRRYAGRLPSAVAAGLTLIAAGGGLNPRPQLISFVLFAAVLHGWLAMLKDRRPRWWLIPVFWGWAMCHGLWMFGLVVGAAVIGVDMLERRERWTRAEVRRAGALWLLCAFAVAATPLGPRLLAAPFDVAHNALTVADEWRPTPMNNVFSWAAVLEVLLCVWLWSRPSARGRVRTRHWWELVLLAFATFCILWMWRLVPLGAVAAAPLVAAAIQDRLTGRREPFSRHERSRLALAVAALLAVAAVLCTTGVGAQSARYPGDVRAIDSALGQLPRGSVVLDDFGISGWLLWRHPELVPAADLRGEIYDRSYLEDYEHALAAEPGWQDYLRQIDARAALVASDSAIAAALTDRLGWTVRARSSAFVLLTPRT